MAAPNLVNVSSVLGKSLGIALTTSSQDVLTAAADKLLKINSVICSNIDGTNDATVNVLVYTGSTSYHIAKLVNVAAGDTVVIVSKDAPIYLEEAYKLQALASANSDIEMVVSYEILDDA
jgi:2-phospho-L-lactate guanylyltransferase (CobY/MobA/RfbA family)